MPIERLVQTLPTETSINAGTNAQNSHRSFAQIVEDEEAND